VLEALRGRTGQVVGFLAAPDPSGHQMSWYPILSMIEAVHGLPPRPSYEDLIAALGQVGLHAKTGAGPAAAPLKITDRDFGWAAARLPKLDPDVGIVVLRSEV